MKPAEGVSWENAPVMCGGVGEAESHIPFIMSECGTRHRCIIHVVKCGQYGRQQELSSMTGEAPTDQTYLCIAPKNEEIGEL